MTTPTPLARGLARVFLALAVLSAPVWASITGWQEVKSTYGGRTYTFYYPKTEQGKPVVTNEGGHATIRLYKSQSESARARSHLFSTDGGKTYRLHIIAEEGPERDVSKGTSFQSRPAAPAPAPSAPSVPAGVDPAVWSDVQAKYGAGLSAADQALLGQVLTHVKKNNSDKYPAVQAWLGAAPRENAAKLVQAARQKGVPAAAAQALEWASGAKDGAAGPADPANGAARPPTPPGAPAVGDGVQQGADAGPLQRLRQAVKVEEHGDEIAARIAGWAWAEQEGGRSFVNPDARKNPQMKPAFDTAFKTTLKDKAVFGPALDVYYLLGPGEPVPAWITKDPGLIKLLVEDQKLIKDKNLVRDLGQCLDRWQHNPTKKIPETCGKQIDRNQARTPYPGGEGEAASWPDAFVRDAAVEATALLLSVKIGTGTLRDQIGTAPGTTPEAPGGVGARQPRLPAMSSNEFGPEQLFGKWGDRNVIYLDGRYIAVTIRTRQTFQGEPPQAVLTHQLGLYDISNQSDIYGRRIDIQSSGETTIDLKPGGKNYKVSFVPDGSDTKIVIERPDGTKPETGSGQPLSTLNELYQARAQQALDSGNRVAIGGKFYRVTGESASTGNLLFWDEAELERNRSSIGGGFAGSVAREWVPSMMAEVVKLSDGRVQPVASTVPLGKKVGDKWLGLRWNEEERRWVPGEGDDFKPKVPAPPAQPGQQPGQQPGGQQPGDQPGGPQPQPGNGRTLPDGWPDLAEYKSDDARAAALNNALGETAKARVRFYSMPEGTMERQAGQRVIAIVSKDIGNQFFPPYPGMVLPVSGGNAAGGSDKESIINGRVLAARTDRGVAFVDLNVVEGRGSISKGMIGLVSGSGNDAVKGVASVEFMTIPLAAAGYSDADAKKAQANMRSILAKSGTNPVFELGGTHARVPGGAFLRASVRGGGVTKFWCVFPEMKVCDQGGESAPGNVPGAGQGVQVDPPTSSTPDDVAFKEVYTLKDNTEAHRVDPKPAEAGLYLAGEGDKRRWLVSVLVKAKDKTFRLDPTQVFKAKEAEGNGLVVPNLPAGLSLHGLKVDTAAAETSVTYQVSPLGGEPVAKKGYLGAYRSSKCVGVAAVWGGSLNDACGACGGKVAGPVCAEK